MSRLRWTACVLAVLVLTAACGPGAAVSTPPGTSAAPSVAGPSATPAASATEPAATGSPAAEPSVPAGAVWVPGHHVAIVPPDGFVAATTFTGFAHEASGSSIVVAELPTGAAELIAGMTDQGLAGQGIEATNREEVTVGGLEGVLIEGIQTAGGTRVGKLLLITGTGSLSVLLNGNQPEGDTTLAAAMRDSFLSIVIDPDRDTDPQAALAFTIDPAPPLRFAGVLTNAAAYNTSGQLPSADQLEPTLIVAPSLGAAVVGDPETFARQRIEQVPQLVGVEIDAVEAVSVAGFDGIEIVASAADDDHGSPMIAWQLLLPTGDGYVLMLGTCREGEADTCLDAFRATAETYQPRT